jgi:hypothetical protein
VFTASAAHAGADRFKSNTFIYVFDDFAAFAAGSDPLQTMRYHTSCSQPIQLGDVIGSVTLVGYVGEDGSVSPLRALGVGELTQTPAPSQQALQDALTSGIQYWQAAGLDTSDLQILRDVQVRLAPLGGSVLGLAYSTRDIVLDSNAAGHTWSTELSGDGVDLISVVTHELGHLLGMDHDRLGMDTLGVGVRQLPGLLLAGDANGDGVFDRRDLVQVLQSARYGTSQRAGWSDGDWNLDGRFDQYDLVAALQSGHYGNHHDVDDLSETDAVFAELGLEGDDRG